MVLIYTCSDFTLKNTYGVLFMSKSGVGRRDFLKGLVGGLIIGAAGGFASGYATAPGKQITTTETVTRPPTLKAAWIYVGPIGDYGWTHAHDVGRKKCEEVYPWLKTDYVERITEEKTVDAIEEFISKGYNVIFTTSFEHMRGTYAAAEKHPDVLFFHCSGYLRRPNMGTYFADLYQTYYLNGLMAGALTKTGKVGYVAAHLIPEVIRHINAFAIGINEINPHAKVYVIEIGEWYAPEMAKEAATTLVEEVGVDVLAFTEDSPATIEYAKDKKIPVFSHYSPMYRFGEDVVVSGQLVRWDVIYKDILAKVYSGLYTNKNLENVDYWYLLNSGAVDVGAQTYEDRLWINPKYENIFKNYMVKEKLTGEPMSLYDLIKLRYNQMLDVNPTFDPFTGPLSGTMVEKGKVLGKEYSAGEKVTVPKGVRLGHDDLWEMKWFLDTVIVQKKAG